jgi:hypothetical protein
MKSNNDNKHLRSFGLIVGGIFALIGLWPVLIRSAEPRLWSLIVATFLILPAVIYRQILFWPGRSCPGLDQHANYLEYRLFWNRDTYRDFPTLVGEGPDGKKAQPRSAYLPNLQQAASGFTSNEAVLTNLFGV